MITFHNEDNMDFMAAKPDNFYDLAIIDPPVWNRRSRW